MVQSKAYMSGSSPDEVPKKRAPRKRAVSTSVDGVVRAPRRRAPRKVAPASVETAPSVPEPVVERREATRKAPTTIRERSVSKNNKRNKSIIAVSIFLVGIGASAVLGLSDKGEIDVNRVVEERNERIKAGGGNPDIGTEIIPVQNTVVQKKADGGLQTADQSTIEPPPLVATTTASTTATTTEAVATSTEETLEESGEVSTEETVESTEATEPEPTL